MQSIILRLLWHRLALNDLTGPEHQRVRWKAFNSSSALTRLLTRRTWHRMVITDDKESRQGSGRQFSPLNRPDRTYTCTNTQTHKHGLTQSTPTVLFFSPARCQGCDINMDHLWQKSFQHVHQNRSVCTGSAQNSYLCMCVCETERVRKAYLYVLV